VTLGTFTELPEVGAFAIFILMFIAFASLFEAQKMCPSSCAESFAGGEDRVHGYCPRGLREQYGLPNTGFRQW
jgi:hypothetical protein